MEVIDINFKRAKRPSQIRAVWSMETGPLDIKIPIMVHNEKEILLASLAQMWKEQKKRFIHKSPATIAALENEMLSVTSDMDCHPLWWDMPCNCYECQTS